MITSGAATTKSSVRPTAPTRNGIFAATGFDKHGSEEQPSLFSCRTGLREHVKSRPSTAPGARSLRIGERRALPSRSPAIAPRNFACGEDTQLS
jgi:hypothetical protein